MKDKSVMRAQRVYNPSEVSEFPEGARFKATRKPAAEASIDNGKMLIN